ncbi:MAG: toluene tolerance protein [Alphaproteobacteria bacterium]|jgi:phospholipid transport system substrate-binding protein|nr:toluene tolerance protein [Alphaproteobacteria bacterium]MBT7942476.1 toluene tolerance protein [Alphaproteobacteria bacterium]
MNRAPKNFKSLILFAFIAFLPIVSGLSVDARAAESGPSETVRGFQATLLQVMKDAKNLNVQQRFERLGPKVKKSFHIPLMVQIASGDYWGEATNSERQNLVNAFRRMSTMTLATLFDGYSGETFKVISERPGPQKTTLVGTKLVKADNSTVDIAYVTRPFKDGWRIIDVIVDNGISELKVRRSEYRLTLKKTGIPGLIKLLNGKADELASN